MNQFYQSLMGITPYYNFIPIGWEAVSAIVLAATALFIYKQSKATKDLVVNETRPVVEVNIMNSEEEGTFLQFLNKRAEIPALVWTTVEIFVGGEKITKDLCPRLSGKEPWRVMQVAYKTAGIKSLATLKDEFTDKKLEISLNIHLAPLFLEAHKTHFYKKSYRYDFKLSKWIDTHWGISDDQFVHPRFLKNSPSQLP